MPLEIPAFIARAKVDGVGLRYEWDDGHTECAFEPIDKSLEKKLPRQANLWVSQSGSGRSASAWYRAISACS